MNGFARMKHSLAVFVSAARVATAVESQQRPLARALHRLGIDAKAFTSVGLG
jgi:hypothetical protein